MKRTTQATEVIEAFVRAVLAEKRGPLVHDERSTRAHRASDEPSINVWWSPPSKPAS